MKYVSAAFFLWLFTSIIVFGNAIEEIPVISAGKKQEILGIDIFYSLGGSSQPVIVLLHGFGASCYSWGKVFDAFAEYATVIAYDRPFFGYSERVTEIGEEDVNPYSLTYQDDLLFGLLGKLGIDSRPLILIGHSAGAAVALQAYFTKPEVVDALVLIAPSLQYSQYEIRAFPFPIEAIANATPFLKKFIKDQLQESIKLAWFNPSLYTESDRYYYTKPFETEGWEKALSLFLLSQEPFNFMKRLPEIAVPTLYISGREDKIIPLSLTRSSYEATKNAELSVITYCGHMPQEEKPVELIDTVTDFLYRHKLVGTP
jgi:pimeloyl-ACP methyl ester carboxylesterase